MYIHFAITAPDLLSALKFKLRAIIRMRMRTSMPVKVESNPYPCITVPPTSGRATPIAVIIEKK